MGPEPGTDGTTPAGPPRGATYAHLLTLVGAFAFWAWWDRGLWFFGDEWDFLVQRGLWHLPANPASIWFPHNEHWSTLPILLWRGLFNVFHLSSYWPYIVPVLVLQLGVMHLSWRLSLRAGVTTVGGGGRRWAARVPRRGGGRPDLGLPGRLRGLGLLRPAGYGTARRLPARSACRRPARLAYAGVALVASLMCSTIGDAMLVAAAVLAAARLPRKQALWVIGPPFALYAVWFASRRAPRASRPTPTVSR